MTTRSIQSVHRESQALVLSPPRAGIQVRQATLDDLPFIDGLQKKHSKMVGWFPTKQVEKNIEDGFVLIAEQHLRRGAGGGVFRVASALSSSC